MKVIVKIGGRWKNCRKTHMLFNVYKKHTKKRMEHLSGLFKFRQPKELLLRPFYYKGEIPIYEGRAQYDPFLGFSILMAPDLFMGKDKGLTTLDHEISHIAAALKYGDWSHGKNFMNVFNKCKKSALSTAICLSPLH